MKNDDILIKIFAGNKGTFRLVNLKSIFEEYDLHIPLYQRPYAWQKENFEDLRETIDNSIESNQKGKNCSDCFLGSVILCKDPVYKDKYFIIDGQQRLTSFLIILRFIYENIQKDIADKENSIDHIESGDSIPKSQFERHKKLQSDLEKDKKKAEEIKDLIDYTKIERTSNQNQTESAILKYINTGEEPRDDKNFINIKKEISEWDNLINRKSDYLDFILSQIRMCVLFIDSNSEQSESFSVDMFNTLNATGVPLTAFEILKSKLYSCGADFTERIEKIEQDIENAHRKKRQNIIKDTGLYLLFLAIYRGYSDKISDKNFTQQNKYLKHLFKDERKTEEIVSDMERIHEFYTKYWNNINLNTGNGLTDFCFEFLRSIKHTRVVPTLLHFQEHLDDCIKLCTTFSVLWRAHKDGSTGGIDNIYREVSENIVKNKIKDVKQLKIHFLSKFYKSKGSFLDSFIQDMTASKVAKNKSVSRFLLLASKMPFAQMSMKDLKKISLTEAKSMEEEPVSYQTLGNLFSNKKANTVRTREDIKKRTVKLTKDILKNLDFI